MQSITPFRWRRRVGMRDVDAFKVVWYGNYLGFCDEARTELLRSFGLDAAHIEELGYIAVVVETHCRYHAPARFDEEIDVHIRVAKSRGTRMTFAHAIRRTADDELLTMVETTFVLLRYNGDLVYLIPEEIGSQLDRLAHDQPDTDP